jgi:anti-anti-sigma regulatory factor
MAKRLVLNAKLDTSSARHLRDELIEAHGDSLVLDGSQVELLGGLCTEVLMSARHLWQQKNDSLTVENASIAMVDQLGRMGLSLNDIATGEAA